ncbi:MAG TPA: 8-oxo-dGTP diphosphatase MutT [Verrucomicrobiae bacterium]|nr:8-oxo-dGTP diphosphatase MutT [Verrucomicrobiae bacterium]
MDAIDVAAGLVFRAGRLLITQRQAQTHLGGLWEFPGGKREAPESFEECLLRELHEELGITVSIGSLIESLVHAYPEKTVRLNFYRCEWISGEPQRLGCADFRWIDSGQLGAFEFPPADERLLAKLRSNHQLWTA